MCKSLGITDRLYGLRTTEMTDCDESIKRFRIVFMMAIHHRQFPLDRFVKSQFRDSILGNLGSTGDIAASVGHAKPRKGCDFGQKYRVLWVDGCVYFLTAHAIKVALQPR